MAESRLTFADIQQFAEMYELDCYWGNLTVGEVKVRQEYAYTV